ncbi:MAG: Uma2 family endonuclease [Thiomonas sp.]|uniref:Uma2 family endonuclease n=1 Tax=Thiomonas sp. TaxID=2047785 RepID=UPI002A35F56D|nr:Uma2 family endonuclease [Thiomonas sp.]MDY0329171.1 Uma2 family endonuclease [Thiomonas sp.]
MSSIPAAERYTLTDWRRWEGDWELIDGQPLAMAPSPAVSHQSVSFALALMLGEQLRGCPECQALFETDVEFGEDTVVRPDVLVICFAPQGERLTRAPSLIAEVVSPESARRDEHTKFALYAEEGVGHYLLLYPQQRKVKAYHLHEGRYVKSGDFHAERHRIDLGPCALQLDCSQLWVRL